MNDCQDCAALGAEVCGTCADRLYAAESAFEVASRLVTPVRPARAL